MKEFFKNLFGKKKTAKEIATEKGEPYVNITHMELSDKEPGIGSFELDWNEYFIQYLRQNGYPGKRPEDTVDLWFQDVCRNIVLESFEQYEAQHPERRNQNPQ